MNSVVLFVVAFACLLGGALVGMRVRQLLPEHHLSPESTDVIKLATGLIATLFALVLSLLVSSANTFHGMIENQYKQGMARIILLDQYLAAYGPEARDIRELLRRSVVHSFQQNWPGEDFGPRQAAAAKANPVIEIETRLLDLNSTSEREKWFRSQALQLASDIMRVRQLMSGDESGQPLPAPVVIVLLGTAAAIFASFSLFVPPNPTVIAALVVAALAASGAIFLIVELNSPFNGLLQLSSDPAHAVIAALRK